MTSVLWYSNETPDICGQGGQRRQYFQIRSLVDAGHDVTVVSLAGEQDDASIRSLTEVRRLPGLGRWARVPSRLRRDDARGSLDGLHRDRVVVAHIESWLHLRQRGIGLGRPQLLDLHNVFSSWYDSQHQRRTSVRWHHWEVAAARDFDAVSVCSERERRAFLHSTGRDSIVVAHGVEPAEWSIEPEPRAEPVMKLFGNWDWNPNRDGLTWFLDRVVPHTRAAGIAVEVAGRGTGTLTAPDGVRFVGRVDDVSTFLADAWVVGVPVMLGVGAPVKYAEALAAGVPVVATTDGAAGADAAEGDGALVSDDPHAWAGWIERTVREPGPARAAALGRRTRVLTEQSWARTTEPLRLWVERG